jgi:Tol biopolymer transport system component
MATVWLAEDLRHGRQVAIKVLHPELSAVLGTERFLAEIRLTAALQHPHILPLFDSGSAEGLLYYVMPFVEGETLRRRLERERQLRVADAVRIASEVADALACAHAKRVVHRDIKPENILLRDGHALVADFGIALAVSQAGGERMTQTGLSLGTPQYMSPEQAAGERNIDARADVYALGAVLFEMLAGEPPFTGASVHAVIAKVMTEAPRPLRTIRRSVPPHLEAAVLTALEKLPADRFAGAVDFAASLANDTRVTEATRHRAPRVERSAAPWLFLGTLAAAALGYAVGTRRPTARATPPVQRFDVALPAHAARVNDILSIMALSLDGSMLAYNGVDSTGQRRIFLRSMDRFEPVPVLGSENATAPSFSPDGRWLSFRVGTRFLRAPVAGGAAEPMCESTGLLLMPATWLEQEAIVFADDDGLRQCDIAGRTSLLLPSGAGVRFHTPHALPGDRAVLFSIDSGAASRLAALDLRSRTLRELGVAGSDPRFVATGHLVYVSPDRRVRALAFDPGTLGVSGDPVLVSDSIEVTLGVAGMGLSRNGTLVHPGAPLLATLELMDLGGRAQRLQPQAAVFRSPSISPDGRRIAVAKDDDIWVLDRAQGALTRLTSAGGAERPEWSPDGRFVLFVHQSGTRVTLRRVAADGATPAESLLVLPDAELWEGRYVPGGRSLLVRYISRGPGRRDIGLVPLHPPGALQPLLQSSADEVAPVVSPDGRWLAYVSNETGRAEVYVRAFPGMGGRVQVSVDGGTEPVWSPRGDALYYRSGYTMVAASLRSGNEVEVIGRRPLFTDPGHPADLTHRSYDMTPDGRQFVMLRKVGDQRLLVTLHRFENLTARH